MTGSPSAPEAPHDQPRRRPRRLLILAGSILVLVLAIVVLQRWGGTDRFGALDDASGNWAYVTVFLLVFGDAICALFPGETTLNTASALAADGGLSLWLVMLAGATGAVAGDSALYWIARLSRRKIQPRLNAAMKHEQVATAVAMIGSSAPMLLLFGRYVPGLRLVVNATFGITAHPYRNFLLWSGIGGTVWSIYTCSLAYLVGTALAGFPLASAVISGAITTIAIGFIFIIVRRRRRTGPGTEAGTVS